ncbi:YqcI/YcgG family protein [Longirhabdus pacifica]|uniref:YqcI/YcgG family protein n=1 Tax=Longirhabdus pacifica TaxID=2305227 RepID=UPI001008B3C5|nr:YqcI/YcgG family protein [Longirhabdus pacifica]
MDLLLKKSWIDSNMDALKPWEQEAFSSLLNIVNDEGNTYPCIPGRTSLKEDSLRFAFIEDAEQDVQTLANVMEAYTACSRNTGRYASLVVFFHNDQQKWKEADTESYRAMFWNVLNQLRSFDKKEWPEEIPTDPNDHQWEFCFHGEPYFAFCATPAHKERKSRYFPYFMLAFQPRWVFKDLNDSTSFGRNMKKAIRSRLAKYDDIPAHPDLKWYGEGDNHEWKQYFLSDDEASPSQCPFHK